MTPIRFGILGFGHHAEKRLLPAFAASTEAELVAFWRRDPAKAKTTAASTGLRAFLSAEELCASGEIDALFITSPDAVHLHDVQLAFAHGKAVLCEKPLAMNTHEAEEMLRAAEAAALLFGVAHNFRWNASVQYMQQRIADGAIGIPRSVHLEFNYAAQHSPRTWITDPTLAAGGPIGDVGVHCIDTLRFLLNTEIETVSTLATTDALSGSVEASAALQLQLASGCIGSVSVSARAAYRTVVEIVGSEGVLVAENGLTVDRPVDVSLRQGGAHVETRTFSNADAYTRMIDNFAEAFSGGNAFLCQGTDGVRNQRVLDAAYRSWHSGQRETA